MSAKFCRAVCLTVLLLVCPGARAATSYHVATTGNDTNLGTQMLPWRHIQKACNTAAPGDTVDVHGGTYNERVTVNVSGSAAGGFVTLQNFPGETPIVDGTGLTVPAGDAALFLLANRSYVIINGFEIRNFKTSSSAAAPAGIEITGASDHIQLRNNKIHSIENNFNGVAANAFGLAVYGTSAASSVNNLVIDGNELFGLKTGSSESLVLNGNVEQFQVTGNRIHDNNNIGIDFIGFEGTCPTAALDQARNGVCRGNTVFNIDTNGNPAYLSGGQYDLSADGIYVDGGANITIERNLVSACDIGVEIASEHAGHFANAIAVRDNVIHHCLTEGISTGGFDTTVGWAQNCVFTSNTLYQNDTTNSGSGELLLQYKVTNCTFKENVFVAGAQNLLIGNPFTQNSGNVVDYNLYFAPGAVAGSDWQWKNVTKTGFGAYQTFSGNDAHSLFADPRFVNAAASDFHLSASSPVINVGDPAFAAGAGETDFDGGPRLNGRVDLGAYEGVSVALTVGNPPTKPEGGASAPGSTTFTVNLSTASGQSVSVNYSTANGTATAGNDYTAASGTLTFAPGETSKSVKVNFIGDAIAEANEKFFLDLKTPINATVAVSRGTAYIRNDDGPTISIANAVTVNEGNSGTTPQTFNVTLSATSTNTITVNFATANGTAGPNDYTTQTGTLTFAPGETSKDIIVLVKGDTVVEVNEKYFVNLSSPTFAVIAISQGTGYIRNDDLAMLLAPSK